MLPLGKSRSFTLAYLGAAGFFLREKSPRRAPADTVVEEVSVEEPVCAANGAP